MYVGKISDLIYNILHTSIFDRWIQLLKCTFVSINIITLITNKSPTGPDHE